MRRTDQRSLCPVSQWLELLGDRWSLLVVRDLLLRGPLPYGELLAAEERVATNILADRLAGLMAAGMVERRVTSGRSHHRYALTDKGFDLLPILLEMVLWGDRYCVVNALGRDLASRYRRDPSALLEELRERQQFGDRDGAVSEEPAQQAHRGEAAQPA